MGQGPRYRTPFRRRRTGQTDYGKRRRLLKGRTTRLVVRPSNRAVQIQFIDYSPNGDAVRVNVTSRDLTSMGWDRSLASLPAAYLTGLLAGQRAKAAGVESALFDLGRARPHKGGRLFAALKGVVDAGVDVPHDEDVLPAENRLKGEHLSDAPLAKFENARKTIEAGGAA